MVARTVKKRTTGRYGFRQLEELWISAGGNRTEAPYAAAIALAESGGNPYAESRNTNGTVDRGLWQINSVHGKLSITNIADNARAAVQIQKESGWDPWVTFKTGAYQHYLTPQNLRSGIKQGEAIQPLAGLAGVLEGKVPGVSQEGKGEESAEKTLEKGLPEWWNKLPELGLTFIMVLAGALLLVYGIAVAVRPREGALSFPRPAWAPV